MDPVPRHGITRRSALAFGAAGLATLTRGVPLAAAAQPVRGLTVEPAAFGPDGVSAVLTAPARFGLLGLLDARRAPGLEVRTRARGGGPSPCLTSSVQHRVALDMRLSRLLRTISGLGQATLPAAMGTI